jgi:putative glycerol-1-phosphate prenyltransferase
MKVSEGFRSTKLKKLAVLIDPDKTENLSELLGNIEAAPPDYIFVGGSFQGEERMAGVIAQIKTRTKQPVVIFPGSTAQIDSNADGILLLSVISSRNAELLIGKHIEASMRLRDSGLDIIPTGYLLIESGSMTTVQYVSQSLPLPRMKPYLAAATALAGEQLGMSAFYLEAGSGANSVVPPEMISAVKATVKGTVICGGGITDKDQLEAIYISGADIAVIGTELERNPSQLTEFIQVRDKINSR